VLTLNTARGEFFGVAKTVARQRQPGNTTRERVLAVTLGLFNAQGPEGVTTADIALACEINEGNLYYWFKRKADIIEALFGQFEAAMIAVAESELGDPADARSYQHYQRGWFDLMRQFRFFYRDSVILRKLAPQMTGRMQILNARSQAAVREVLRLMRAHGLLAISDADMDVLINNLWIVSGHWMDFFMVTFGRPPVSDEDLAWGYKHVQRLFDAHVTGVAVQMKALG